MSEGWSQILTMREAFAQLVKEEDGSPWVALGNFGNRFFAHPELRQQLINDPIEIPGEISESHYRWAVYCAASVDYLCNKYQLTKPAWTDQYCLEHEWFQVTMAYKNPEVRERYLASTPIEFARKNVFFGDRVWQYKREEAEKMRQVLAAASH